MFLGFAGHCLNIKVLVLYIYPSASWVVLSVIPIGPTLYRIHVGRADEIAAAEEYHASACWIEVLPYPDIANLELVGQPRDERVNLFS